MSGTRNTGGNLQSPVLTLPKPGALQRGLPRSELATLQTWLISALSSRKALEATLPAPSGVALQALITARRQDIGPFASALAHAHGLSPVLTALLAPFEVLLLRDYGAKTDWLAPPDTPSGRRLALRPMVAQWIHALAPLVTRADPADWATLRAIAERGRTHHGVEVRAALARAFRIAEWVLADAAEVLAMPEDDPRLHGEQTRAIGALLPLVEDEALFDRLIERRRTYHGFDTPVLAEIVAFTPTRAVARLVKLLQKPLMEEEADRLGGIIAALSAFEDPAAAEAIASAASLVPKLAKAYFHAHPALLGHLEARARGRGRKVEQVREILVELERQRDPGEQPAPSDLPRCLAEPPWLHRAEPWAARSLDLIVQDFEQLVETPALADARAALAKLAEPEGAASAARDAEILATKGVLGEPYLRLTEQAAFDNVHRLGAYYLHYALAKLGVRGIAPLAAVLNQAPLKTHAEVLGAIRSPRLAEVAFRFHRLDGWLFEQPTGAALGLVPPLFSTDLARRYEAELGLLRLWKGGHQAAVRAAARRYGESIEREVTQIMERDGWQRLPPELPALHPAFEDDRLPRVALPSGTLPASVNRSIGLLLAVSQPWLPHPGLDELRRRCTVESLDAFAWEAYKKTGALSVLGYLGGDHSARYLEQELSSSRGAMKPAERRQAHEVLAQIGSPLALMLLYKQALFSPWPDRITQVQGLFVSVARQRGTSVEALEDERFPNFGADVAALTLDYGPRRFRVELDDQLEPCLFDEAGARLAKLPRPTKKDDPHLAAAAAAKLAAMSLDLDDVRETILTWFERAMTEQHTWTLNRFRRAILGHPLLVQLGRLLIWQAAQPGENRPPIGFRVAEDNSFADAGDDVLRLGEEVEVRLGHPALCPSDELAAFRKLFVEYELIQPFEQLERAVYQLGDDERAQTTLPRFAGRIVAHAPLEKLLGRGGWLRGEREERMLKRVACGAVQLEIKARGVHARGAVAADRLGALTLEGELPFGRLSLVEASELLRDLTRLPSA